MVNSYALRMTYHITWLGYPVKYIKVSFYFALSKVLKKHHFLPWKLGSMQSEESALNVLVASCSE